MSALTAAIAAKLPTATPTTLVPTWTAANAVSLPAAMKFTGVTVIDSLGRTILLQWSNSSGTAQTSVYRYDPAAGGSWSIIATLQDAFGGSVAIDEQDRLYIIGGINGSTPTNRVRVLDTITGTWSLGTSLPGTKRQTAACSDFRGRIVVAGNPANTALPDTNYRFTVASGTWEMVPTLNTYRDEHTLVADRKTGAVFALQGRTTVNSVNATTKVVERLDPVALTWSTRQPSQLSLSNTAAGYDAAGRVVLATGYSVSFGSLTWLSLAARFDPSDESWVVLPNFPDSRRYAAAVRMADGSVGFAGGQATNSDGGALTFGSVFLDPSPTFLSGQWVTGADVSAFTLRTEAAIATDPSSGITYVTTGFVPGVGQTQAGFTVDPAGVLTAMPNSGASRRKGFAAWLGGRLILSGGYTLSSGTSGTVQANVNSYAYTPAGARGESGTWASIASLPAAGIGAVAATLGALMYVCGGGTGTTSGSQTVRTFDGTAWGTAANLPGVRRDGALLVYGGKLYYIGGLSATTSTSTTATIFVFDAQAGTWSTSPWTLAVPTSGPAVLIGSVAYLWSGGNLQSIDLATGATSVAYPWGSPHGDQPPMLAQGSTIRVVGGELTTVDTIDPTVGSGFRRQLRALRALLAAERNAPALAAAMRVNETAPTPPAWTTLTTLPSSLTNFASGTDGQRLYVSHGYAVSVNTTAGVAINPDGTRYNLPAASVARSSPGSAFVGDKLWVVGGSGTNGQVANVEVYTPAGVGGAQGSWSAGPALPSAFARQGLAAIGTDLYAVGGTNSAGRQARLFKLDTVAGTAWQSLTSLPEVRELPAVVAWNGKLYSLGGLNSAGSASGLVYVYDPNAGTWSTLTTTGSAGTGTFAVLLGSVVYLMGIGGAVWTLDLATAAWSSSGPQLSNTFNYSGGGAVIGERIVVAGGGASTNAVDVLDVNAQPRWLSGIKATKSLAALAA